VTPWDGADESCAAKLSSAKEIDLIRPRRRRGAGLVTHTSSSSEGSRHVPTGNREGDPRTPAHTTTTGGSMKSVSRRTAALGWTLALLPGLLLGCNPETSIEPPAAPARTSSTAQSNDLGDAVLVFGNLIFGDHAFNGILRYDATGAPIDAERFVPALPGGAGGGCCMTFGPDDHLYVSSTPAGDVLRFNGVTGEFIDVFVPSGSGGLQFPLAPAFGPDGNLYVGDFGSHSILRYDGTTGAFIDEFVEAGAGGMVLFDPQLFVFGPDGHIYAASQSTNRILRFDGTTGALDEAFFPAGNGGVVGPTGVTFGPDGDLYVSSTGDDRVLRYDGQTGAFIGEFVSQGSGGLQLPVGLTFGPDGHLYVTSPGSSRETASILRYDGRTGEFLDVFVAPGSGGITGPRMLEWKSTVTICHRPPGNPARARTMTIGYRLAGEHVDHGDVVGQCG
jgi:streptogramin lyase